MTAETEETPEHESEETETQQAGQHDQQSEKPAGHDRLPDDHPVVKALNKANKEAEQARLKVKEFEDRDKTEAERTSEKLQTLEKDLTTAQADAVRFEIALDKGLTKSQAKRLVGSTREELEADAEELVADLGLDEQDETSSSNRPKEKLKPGASNEDDDSTVDGEKIAEKILSKTRI